MNINKLIRDNGRARGSEYMSKKTTLDVAIISGFFFHVDILLLDVYGLEDVADKDLSRLQDEA